MRKDQYIEMLEDKIDELESQKIMKKWLLIMIGVLIGMIITVLFYNYGA